MKSYDTLVEAINDLKERGYTHDFSVRDKKLYCTALEQAWEMPTFHVDEFHRFEGESNPDDMSVIYAIHTDSGIKGILVSAYGTYTDEVSANIAAKLNMSQATGSGGT